MVMRVCVLLLAVVCLVSVQSRAIVDQQSTGAAAVAAEYKPEALADEIKELPGLPAGAGFRMFSGYINVSTTRALFYWFVEAQEDPSSKPVMLWTNGGPGCSGLGGFFSEQGPFRPTANHTLTPNPYAWNKVANMIFIEQPAGVGFSINSDPGFDYGDGPAATDNLAFVRAWMNRFDNFAANDFFISSESYGGHYMPTLARALLSDTAKPAVNFKGFLVGNPLTYMPHRNYGEIMTYAGHSLLPKPLVDQYLDLQCWYLGAGAPQQTKDDKACTSLMNQFKSYTQGLDPYALDFPTCDTSAAAGRQERHALVRFLSRSRSNALSMVGVSSYFPDEYQPCEQDYLAEYLNLPEVQSAIHVSSEVDVLQWSMCSGVVGQGYNATDVDSPMMPVYDDIFNLAAEQHMDDLKVMVYSGDDDAVCASLGSQLFIWYMGYDVVDQWKPYSVDGQVAGYTVGFQPKVGKVGFRFTTVHGAGHMVPQTRPSQALQVVRNFLANSW